MMRNPRGTEQRKRNTSVYLTGLNETQEHNFVAQGKEGRRKKGGDEGRGRGRERGREGPKLKK